MLPKQMESALNTQIEEELFASYLYLSMSAYCHSLNFKGFANWMRMQAGEEREHAMKLYDYIIERGGRVELEAMKKPAHSFSSIIETFSDALAHEKKVSTQINKLYEQAEKLKDYPSRIMLQWFITEQVEEEMNAEEIVQKLKFVGNDKNGLLLLDRDLGSRQKKS